MPRAGAFAWHFPSLECGGGFETHAKLRAFLMETGSTTILRSHNFTASDTREALEHAARHVDGHEVELWEGEKLIKRFDRDEPKI